MKKIIIAFCTGFAIFCARYIPDGGIERAEHLLEKCITGGILFACIYILYISTEEPRQ